MQEWIAKEAGNIVHLNEQTLHLNLRENLIDIG